MLARHLTLPLVSSLLLLPSACTDDAEAETDSTAETDSDAGSDAETDADTDSEAGTETTGSEAGTETTGSDDNPALPELFDQGLFTVDPTTVDCQLDDGSTTQCYQLSFSNYQGSSGPFCPPTIDDIGGVGIYDGPTNPGFQVLKDTLWNAMEADGYDIVDDEGNVTVNGGGGVASCLNMATQDLTLTFLIPVEPVLLDTPNEIEIVELYGVSLFDGMPLTGHPPSVVDGPPIPGSSGGSIPSLDPCGGHGDPAGYWHWHFNAKSSQSVLDAFDITEVSCTDIQQQTEGLVGFAKDGYPIYSPLEDGSVPADLDACNGKFGVTPEFPAGIYHYYALHEEAPNLPTCIMGASALMVLSID
ncbi:YHYH protein [Pseudenhygromyxa sp. WMMC2535]|uniref:YHYH protein n=1 Tax=Pseudenhygromyxa sp. WMMC2535 TaxID=2712867 RepID=UPI001555AF01|nr:YHYH protein [Pseudenhygromyxa sp. WMMC2535]NVB37649.1 YHYH protein [Pseudenhygromyxa sp. WMMC2535]